MSHQGRCFSCVQTREYKPICEKKTAIVNPSPCTDHKRANETVPGARTPTSDIFATSPPVMICHRVLDPIGNGNRSNAINRGTHQTKE